MFLCIIMTIKELKHMPDNSQYGKNTSAYPILLNFIWNYLVSIGQLMTLIRITGDNLSFVPSAILTSLCTLLFIMNVLLHAQKLRNEGYILSQLSNESIRLKVCRLNCWMFTLIAVAILVVFNVRFNGIMFTVLISVLWVPQIITNFITLRSKVPSLLYIVFLP